MPHFCDICDRMMRRHTTEGAVKFMCACGAEVPGGADDARIGGEILSASETVELYNSLVKRATSDRTNAQIEQVCPLCNRDYATQVLVGAADQVVIICACSTEK